MSKKAFDKIADGLRDAIAIARGLKPDPKTKKYLRVYANRRKNKRKPITLGAKQ